MNRSARNSTAPLIRALVACGVLSLAAAAAAETPAHQYVGVSSCAMCHKSPAKGDQYGKWLATPHAKAFEVLASEKALAIAKEKGLKTAPQESDACLKCHVTGYGQPATAFAASFKKEQGVQCESCHGPGSAYKAMNVMKDHAASVAAGLEVPNEATCTKCHNSESPTFKGFDFKAAFAKVQHPRPKG